ncbi:MAG: hypothetical protein LC112_07710 [Flavobacteriales bacterium]|nr:hypothetical protein [Flavobacteriales bacterium]
MKKITLLFVSLFLLSCSDKNLSQIEKNITDNAMGADVGYVKGKLEEPLILKYNDVIKIYKDQIGDDPSTDLDDFISSYKRFANDDKQNNNVSGYWHNTGRYKMFETWKGLKPDDKVYSIQKYTYGVNNMLQPGEKRQVTNYYIFDKSDKLITKLDESEYLEYKRDFIKSPNFGFIVALVNYYGKPTEEIITSEEVSSETSINEAERIIDSAAAVTESEIRK